MPQYSLSNSDRCVSQRHCQLVPGLFFVLRRGDHGRFSLAFIDGRLDLLCGLDTSALEEDATPLLMRCPPEDVSLLLASLDESERDMALLRVELRIEGRHIEVSALPEYTGGRQTVVQWQGFLHDVTALRRAEAEQIKKTQLLHSVLQGIPDPVWMKDNRGVFLICNPGVARLFNRKEDEIVGRTDGDFFEKEMVEFYRSNDQAAMRAGSTHINEEWWTFADNGESVLMETRKVPVKCADGKVLGVLGVARDITERKRVQERLAQREHEFRTLLENTPDTVARYGPDLRRKFVNPAHARFFGKHAEELLERKPSETPGGPDGQAAEEKLRHVFTTGNEAEFEHYARGDDSESACLLVHMVPEFNEKGEVQSVLSVGRDITELNRFRKKIHQMAYYDSLTGLPNRALFYARLRQMISDASRDGQSTGVMMIDLNRFKAVNDSMGHATGDQLLREAARRLARCIRADDMVARLGGDEFAILLPTVRSSADVERIADKIFTGFSKPFLLDGKAVFVTCSIGIARCPEDSGEEQDLLKFADSAMYVAKRSGRNKISFYEKEGTGTRHASLARESELRRAFEYKQLELHYQPKVSLRDGSVVGSEALLRWRHPELGVVPSAGFIDVAEDTGLIVDIGRWVLYEACRTASIWNSTAEGNHKIAVNLSARQLHSPRIGETLRHALEDASCRPEWIELEISENVLLEGSDQTLGALRELREIGVSIAIDDFGTRYTALGYLASSLIDTVKIDRTFIAAMETDVATRELVRAILCIARCLGQEIVAEGVETPAQADFLEAHGCQVAQGFLYSAAVPREEFPSVCN